jgi:hypothetical protein
VSRNGQRTTHFLFLFFEKTHTTQSVKEKKANPINQLKAQIRRESHEDGPMGVVVFCFVPTERSRAVRKDEL